MSFENEQREPKGTPQPVPFECLKQLIKTQLMLVIQDEPPHASNKAPGDFPALRPVVLHCYADDCGAVYEAMDFKPGSIVVPQSGTTAGAPCEESRIVD